jgi:hypothetical protein
MSELKAKIARHSIAMAKIFNAEIVYFICGIANHDLFSASLDSSVLRHENRTRPGLPAPLLHPR